MSTTKFTPGPWVKVVLNNGHAISIHADSMPLFTEVYPNTSSIGSKFPVCGFSHSNDHDFTESGKKRIQEINNKNASLIAAAPEMYKLLQRLQFEIIQESPVYSKLIEDLLTKARGES